MEMSAQIHAPTAWPPEYNTASRLKGGGVGLQSPPSRFWRIKNFLPFLRFELQTVNPVASQYIGSQ